MNMKIRTKINLLPFGSVNYKSVGLPVLYPQQLREKPIYGVPLTTNVDSLEFSFFDETLPIPADSEESLE